jgi:CCR4-NOT transcriptional regulation complex NOT5 subunit
MVYFDQPDEIGHHKKSDSDVDRELKNLERVIDQMFTLFKKENLLDCINLVVLSDHGGFFSFFYEFR